MKKTLIFFAMLVMAFFMASCSKDDEKKKIADGSIVVSYNNYYTVDIDKLILDKGQGIALVAVVKDVNGRIITDAAVNWTLSPGLGTLTQNQGERTKLTVSDSASGEDHFIKAEYDGIEKKISVKIDKLHVQFQLMSGGTIIGAGAGNDIKVTVTRASNGQEDKDSKILLFASSGSFSEPFTFSGEWNTYNAVDGLTGTIEFIAIINDKLYSSPEYTIVEN